MGWEWDGAEEWAGQEGQACGSDETNPRLDEEIPRSVHKERLGWDAASGGLRRGGVGRRGAGRGGVGRGGTG